MNTQLQNTYGPEKLVVQLTSDIDKRVNCEIRRCLVNEYRKLFAGLLCIKCKNNQPWGRIWQSALDNADMMLMMAKHKNSHANPAVKYLGNAHQSHKKYWAKAIVTHPKRDSKPNMSPQMLDKIYNHGQRLVAQATSAIMQILQRYNERPQEKTLDAQIFNVSAIQRFNVCSARGVTRR